MFIYLNIVKATGPALYVKGQEVECDHVAVRLVDDPLTNLVVGVGVGMVGGPELPRPR